jgi:hypothetical protein
VHHRSHHPDGLILVLDKGYRDQHTETWLGGRGITVVLPPVPQRETASRTCAVTTCLRVDRRDPAQLAHWTTVMRSLVAYDR